MSNPSRRFLALPLLVLHVAISLCGPGHHATPAESREPIGIAGESDRRSDHCVTAADTAASHADSHCPLCDYLSQPAAPPVAHAGLSPCERVEVAGPRRYPASHHTPPLGPSIPRGPPSSVAI